MALTNDLQNLRNVFLFDVSIQARLRATADVDAFLNEAIKIATEKKLDVKRPQLVVAIANYARTGVGSIGTCVPVNPPPFSTAAATDDEAVATAIAKVRATPGGVCSW